MGLSSLLRRRSPESSRLEAEADSFWKKGYVIVRGCFAAAEMAVLKQIVARHAEMQRHAAHAIERSASAEGTRPSFETLFVWNDTSRRDAFAKATRSRKIMDRLEAFFGDEVYVYHNKIALKYPGVVGFRAHQDYAYWYGMGNLFPDMATAMIAIDRQTRENGCLSLVEGSHRLGRLEHIGDESDSGVDPERLEQILRVLPDVPIELEVGDVVLFHCNVLHASGDNHSGESRIGLLGCYNTRHNDPYRIAHGHPGWHRQEKLEEPITAEDLENLPDFTYQWPAQAAK